MFCDIYRGKGKLNNKKYDFKKSYDGRSHHPHLCNNRNYFVSILGGELQYRDYFTQEDIDKLREAYNKSHDIRKFEIELYWKRATYFWTLTAALITFLGLTVTAYLGKSNIVDPTKILSIGLAITTLGLLLTIITFFMSQAGKYWQTNWEDHINNLEFLFSGNLHKTHIKNKKNGMFSISKLNEATQFIFIVFWTMSFNFITLQFHESYFMTLISSLCIILVFFSMYLKLSASPDKKPLE
ncbi:hypothetical protein WCU73_02475 [Pectobacterium brasiliense]|uniref:RipA family octameric membrane protein n=1 Tax=Pectobacterium brasiliense TaxID=180957 RepID=UPI00301AFDC3